jgi:hypothetical protein
MDATGMLWFVGVVLVLPLLAFLVLIGLVFEVNIRIDRARLGPIVEWLLAAVATVALVLGVAGLILRVV